MDEYKDIGVSNWISASQGTAWTVVGGDYLNYDNYDVVFPRGFEDLELDVSEVVENWIKGSGGGEYDNYGFGIRRTDRDWETQHHSYRN